MKTKDHGRSHSSQFRGVPARWCAVLAATLAALTPEAAHALGSRIPNQDAAAIARGNAFVATADNPSALYYNPAGITQLEGQHFQLGALTYLNIYADYKSPSGAKIENQPDIIAVPQFHYTYSLKDSPFSFGLGAYAPFGLGMEWPDDAPFRTAGIEARINYVTINPVVAWQPLENLSLAIGPNFNYSDVKLRQGVGAVPNDSFVFRGDDIGFGFNAGVLWKPHPQWSLGANYRSASTLDYEGDGSFSPSPPLPGKLKTSTTLEFPQIISGGVSYRPTTNWNIEVDVDWTDWNTVNDIVIKNVGILTLNWTPSFFYEAGVTRYLANGYYVSAGYFFSEASTPDKNYTPLVPDTDLHVASLGVGRKGRNWDWAFAAQLIGGSYREVTGNVNPTVNGRYRLVTPTISASIGYHF